MYVDPNFQTKKLLLEAIANGIEVKLYCPGLENPLENGIFVVEGPGFPKPHTWHGVVTLKEGFVVSVK